MSDNSKRYIRTPSDSGEHETDRFLNGSGHWDRVPSDPIAAISHIAHGLKAEQQARHNYREQLNQMVDEVRLSHLQHEDRMDKLEEGLTDNKKQNNKLLSQQEGMSKLMTEMHTALIGNEMGTTGIVKRVAIVEKHVSEFNRKAFAHEQVKKAGKTWVDLIVKLWPILLAAGAAAAGVGIASN